MKPINEMVRRHWQPKEITPPTVDPELKQLDGPQRLAEVVRYTLLSVEWWLSPNGRLREWVRFNGKISSVLLIPAVLVMPLVTLIIWQVGKWLSWLVGIAGYLILLPLAGLVAAGVTLGVIAIIRSITGK